MTQLFRFASLALVLCTSAACATAGEPIDAGMSAVDAGSVIDSVSNGDSAGAYDAAVAYDAAIVYDASPEYDACVPGVANTQFDYTGGVQMFVVPVCVTSIIVDAFGAEGGDGDGSAVGGLGGHARATVAVTPGETLEVYVGGAGTTVINSLTGGYNGGGGSIEAVAQNLGDSGTGGGASDVRRGSALADRLVVGGGGGGGGWSTRNGFGGAGGDLVGEDGNSNNASYPAGGGGTQVAGGIVGWAQGDYTNQPGEFGVGGLAYHDGAGTGGGGGGWYGGGTGGFAGGGGGSGYVAAAGNTDTFMENGVRTGNGVVTISW